MAHNLIQYCIAWMSVIERIPPVATPAYTTTARTTLPAHAGQPVAWRRARPAAWNWGTR